MQAIINLLNRFSKGHIGQNEPLIEEIKNIQELRNHSTTLVNMSNVSVWRHLLMVYDYGITCLASSAKESTAC